MIIWLEKSLALAIHNRQLAEHGGSTGVRDEELLESALTRPRQLYTYHGQNPDLADLAASLAFGLARTLSFVDGNKRTAHVCYRVFLALNDVELDASDKDKYVTILALAEGKLPEKDFATWLRKHISVRHGKQIQEPRAAPYRAHRPRRNAQPG